MIKEIRDWWPPYKLTGYLVDGVKKEQFQAVDDISTLIAEGGSIEPAYTPAEYAQLDKDHILNMTTIKIDRIIQGEIDNYNKLNNIKIGSIHNAADYIPMTTYSHQAFCEQVWNWSVGLWDGIRTWGDSLEHLPTDAEIDAEIANYPFNFQS